MKEGTNASEIRFSVTLTATALVGLAMPQNTVYVLPFRAPPLIRVGKTESILELATENFKS